MSPTPEEPKKYKVRLPFWQNLLPADKVINYLSTYHDVVSLANVITYYGYHVEGAEEVK